MITRRGFFKGGAASGIIFCSCGLLDHARAQQPARKKLPVKVRGKRVRTIDVHAHCNFQEAIDLMGPDGASVLPGTRVVESRILAIEERIRNMDAMGIDMQVLSPPPVIFCYWAEAKAGQAFARLQNENVAAIAARHPRRARDRLHAGGLKTFPCKNIPAR